MICKYISLTVAAVLLTSCSTTSKSEHPLKNSSKLIKEGHLSLYHNGAFQVPSTEIKLIPPGPSAVDVAGEFVGLRAHQSFLLSLQNAQSAVYLISDGTKKSYEISKDVYGVGEKLAAVITKASRPGSKSLILKSAGDAYGISGASFQFSKTVQKGMQEYSVELNEWSRQSGKNIDVASADAAKSLNEKGVQFAKDTHGKSVVRSTGRWQDGKNQFVKVYIELPDKWEQYSSGKNPDQYFSEMKDDFSENEKWQSKHSQEMQTLVKSSGQDYFSNIGNSLENAQSEFSGSLETEGISLATLKASRWVLQALFYDAVVAPLSKVTYGSLGYIFVNGVAYPVLLAKDGTVAVTKTAVQFTWDGARMTGAVVAPTLEAGLAGIIAGADLIGSEVLAGSSYVGSKVGSAFVKGGGKVAAVTVQGGGYVGSKGLYYIGVPVAMTGVTVGGTAVGTVYGAGEAAAGAALYIGGEAAQVASHVASATSAGVILVGGTVGSAAVGGGLAVYEMGKSIVVPTGYTVGAGVVLGYSSMTHLAAHSVLAVSDAAYLVLSMEGPRWVIYAVKGNTGKGENLQPGAVLDLEQMRKHGEELHYVPASQEEIKKVIESLPKDNKL